MKSDKYFSSLLYSIWEGLNSFFSSETHEKICPIVRKKKNVHLRMNLELKPMMGKFSLLYANIAPNWNTMISCEGQGLKTLNALL